MNKSIRFLSIIGALFLGTGYPAAAQVVTQYTSTEDNYWQHQSMKISTKATLAPVIEISGEESGVPFKAWGTTFNELDWDAFNLLSRNDQDKLMHDIFAADGDLKFTHGRVSMNANDYARSWYSCDDVVGDLDLKYFNIERDKRNIIPLARAAQKYCPELQLFASPWSPPAWMKINQDYCVLSSPYNVQDSRKDYLLYMEDGHEVDADEMKLMGDREEVFPRRLATQDYFIQDPRYLQSYANMFCRFIDLYSEQGLPITKVMYQNEAYSYTVYPGCAWTAEGTLRFNNDYLAPTLHRQHPEVELWIGTFNTNRLDYVQMILDNKTLQQNVRGIGTQWECRRNLPEMRKRYPNLRFMVSESECGNGDMDWKAGEHTFFLLADNLGNGCDEYYNWNFVLKDKGESTWGWTQNALVQVNSQTRQMRYTAEYYAYKHFSNLITPGTEMIAYSGRDADKPASQDSVTPMLVLRRPTGEYVIVMGNLTDDVQCRTIRLGKKYLNIEATPHSFNTYVVNKL